MYNNFNINLLKTSSYAVVVKCVDGNPKLEGIEEMREQPKNVLHVMDLGCISTMEVLHHLFLDHPPHAPPHSPPFVRVFSPFSSAIIQRKLLVMY